MTATHFLFVDGSDLCVEMSSQDGGGEIQVHNHVDRTCFVSILRAGCCRTDDGIEGKERL